MTQKMVQCNAMHRKNHCLSAYFSCEPGVQQGPGHRQQESPLLQLHQQRRLFTAHRQLYQGFHGYHFFV